MLMRWCGEKHFNAIFEKKWIVKKFIHITWFKPSKDSEDRYVSLKGVNKFLNDLEFSKI